VGEMKEPNDEFNPENMPWENGYYGTVDGESIGLCDGSYEIIGEGCYRRLPADPGSEPE